MTDVGEKRVRAAGRPTSRHLPLCAASPVCVRARARARSPIHRSLVRASFFCHAIQILHRTRTRTLAAERTDVFTRHDAMLATADAFVRTVRHGTPRTYDPTTHRGFVVCCDRCKKHGIRQYVSSDGCDLCSACVDAVRRTDRPQGVVRTRMMQHDLRPKYAIETMMMQDFIRPSRPSARDSAAASDSDSGAGHTHEECAMCGQLRHLHGDMLHPFVQRR